MAKKKEETRVTQHLIIKAPSRKTSDVGAWRNALTSADMGRVKTLYDLYEDLLIDGVLSDAIDKRINAVVNSPITFQDADGLNVPELTAVIDTPGFEELLKTIMHRLFWGRSAGEFDFNMSLPDGSAAFNFTEIPSKHIHLANRMILLNDSDETGIPFDGDDHLLVLGAVRQFGLLLKAAPYAIWKRGGFGDYAQWLEIFGMPQRVGKYSSYDPENRRLLEAAMEAAGSAPWIVIPRETEVETTNAGNSGDGAAYNDFRRACNEEILITILGQTLTTTQNDTGARSLGEVHKEVEEEKNKADMRYVQRVLNFMVLPLLEKRGFPVKGGKFIFPESATELTVSDIVLLSEIIDIPAQFLHDKFSIPMPQKGEPIARHSVSTQPGDGAGDNKSSPETIKNSDSWLGRMHRFFALAPTASWRIGASSGEILTMNDGTLTDRIIKQAVSHELFLPELFEFISFDLVKALDDLALRHTDLGFDYTFQDDAFRTAQELNIFHFSAAKTLAEIQMVNQIYRESKDYNDFRRKAEEIIEVFNERWQKTEYETATLISESTANYNRLKGKTKLFPYWQYKTVGDEKVREEHRMIADIILPANDPRWDKIFPPNGWKCRCWVVPLMAHEVSDQIIKESRQKADLYINSPEFKKAQALGFGVNRATTPQVFNENQQYIRKFPQQASRLLKNVNYQTYGLKSYQDSRKLAKENTPVFSLDIDSFSSSLEKENGKPFLIDYNNRKVLFDVEEWKKIHGPKKQKSRSIYLLAMEETIKRPDEVWINNGVTGKADFNQFVFIKYYKNETIAVIAGIEKGTVYKINTWFPIVEVFKTENKAKREVLKRKFRSGLLIKKPGDYPGF